MKRIKRISGKIGIKHIVLFFIFIFVFLMSGNFQAPFVARHVHNKIKIGMTGDEVRDALSGWGRYHLFCKADVNVKDNTIFRDNKCFATIASLPNQQQIQSVQMTVLFMGPVFWHNDFIITFGSDGKVKQISPVRGWD